MITGTGDNKWKVSFGERSLPDPEPCAASLLTAIPAGLLLRFWICIRRSAAQIKNFYETKKEREKGHQTAERMPKSVPTQS